MHDPKRTVVTGGAGFIGSHLVDRLLADGHEVVVLDSLVAGRRENLQEAEGHPKLTFHHADIASLDNIKPYFEGVDWVFHLAALADIVPSIQHPLDLPSFVVPLVTRVLEPWTTGEAERSPEAMVLSFQVLGADSPVNRAA